MRLQKNIALILVLSGALLGKAKAQDSTALTLDQCLKTALANNIAVKQQNLLLQTADANYKQAQYNRLPNVSGELNYGINNGRNIDPNSNTYITQKLSSSNVAVSASLPIFTGWQTSNTIKQNKLTLDASKLELQQEQDNLTLNVISAFLQIISNEDILELTKKQANVTSKQVERNTILNNEGSIAPSTLSDLKGQYATEEISIVNAENAVQTSKLALTQLMNINYNKDLKIDRSGLDLAITAYLATADEVYTTALKNLAYVKAAELRQQAAAKAVKVAASGRYPTVSLFSQVGTNYSSAAQLFFPTGTSDVKTGDFITIGGVKTDVFTTRTDARGEKITYLNQLNNNIGTFIGVNLRVPIFSALQTRTRINLAKIQEKNAAYLSENTKLLLRQSVETAHLNMLGAYNRYVILVRQVDAFQESFRAAEIKLNEGVGNSVDYLIVKNNLDRSKLNLTNAKYEYLLRTKVLDFYQGLLK